MAEPRRPSSSPVKADGARFLIVEARFYDEIGAMLLAGATTRALEAAGATVEVISVPGALEIPIALALSVEDNDYAGAVALGCVIRGDTYHFEIVCNESARALTQFAVDWRLCFGNGILTVETEKGWSLIRHYGPLLLDASVVTIVLSVCSMPLAMAIGLIVALGRLHGPRPLKIVLGAYVELLRGTPLMLQLYALFYLLKLPPWVAGIGGLAINYSAYEAEIYRAGLQAIPAGQMEAALALGMSRRMALRRVIVPQAARIVIPPVTNDFIALFKDTSVCSVITLVELTQQYSFLANSTGGVIEFALATAFLYMMMSLPLSWFSRWSERRFEASGTKGGTV